MNDENRVNIPTKKPSPLKNSTAATKGACKCGKGIPKSVKY